MKAMSLRVASTDVFEQFQLLIAVSPGTRTAGRGEQAAAEVLGKELTCKNHGAILPFETSDVRKQNLLLRLPIQVLVVSTSEFLFGLQCL